MQRPCAVLVLALLLTSGLSSCSGRALAADDVTAEEAIAFWKQSKELFDFAFYREFSSDLAAVGMNDDQLWRHWATSGILEGRKARTKTFRGNKEVWERQQRAYAHLVPPDHPGAAAWLQAFYREHEQEQPLPEPRSRAWWWDHAANCGWRAKPSARRGLVLAAVGDSWDPADWWLQRPGRADFDLAVIYYGKNDDWRCEQCVLTLRRHGAFYHILHQLFLNEPPELSELLAHSYDHIAILDDDLEINTCELNVFFAILREYDIKLGQPSTCRANHTFVSNDNFYQVDASILRFLSITELQATTFDLAFFNAVVKHTYTDASYTGWGLEGVWPALLHHDDRSIATVDAVCMMHLKPGEAALRVDSIYLSGLPRQPEEERTMVLGRFNITIDMLGPNVYAGVADPAAEGGTGGGGGGPYAAAVHLQVAAVLAVLLLVCLRTCRRKRPLSRPD